MSADDTETSDWTDAALLKLLAAMKSSIPEDKRHLSYATGVKHMDWKTVAFPPFSPAACRQKWSEIMQKLRKTRSYVELMDEAEDAISNTAQQNSEFLGEPKMPTQTGRGVFWKEHTSLLCEKIPCEKERFLEINKMWNNLSDAEKQPYKENAQEDVRKYSMELQKWFKTLTAAEQNDYLACKPSKHKFLDVKTAAKSKGARKKLLSDSEHEDTEDSMRTTETVKRKKKKKRR